MPNRILREGILTSERVNELSWPAEVFYRRLMSAVDDFGRFWAKPDLLRAALYPLRLEKVSNSDVVKWIGETREAGLVRAYSVGGKEYLQLLDFRQQVRAKESKFPPPTSECIATATQTLSRGTASAHLDVDVVEGDIYVGQKPDVARKQEALEILIFLNDKAGRDYKPVAANLDLIMARLKEGATAAECKAVVQKKCVDWAGDDRMADYLRPATLFNRTKFAQYQGEIGRTTAIKVDL